MLIFRDWLTGVGVWGIRRKMDALDQAIAEKSRAAESLRAQLRVLEAEIAALQLAAKLRPATTSTSKPRATRIASGGRGGGRRQGDISHDWRAILGEIFQRGTPVDYAGIANIAESHGKPLAPSSIRDRIRNMVNTGLVAAAPDGGFVVTAEAVERFGFTKRNDPPEGGSDGGVGASPEVPERGTDGDPPSVFS